MPNGGLLDSKQLLRLLGGHPALKQLGDALGKKRNKNIRVDGLCSSSTPLYFAALSRSRSQLPTLLFVLDDSDEAGYFYHDLMQMTDDRRVLFFPSSYRRAIKYNQRDSGNEILRTEVLTTLSALTDEPLLIVTYPEALAELVVPKQQLDANTQPVAKGDTFDFRQLEDRLDQLGFLHVDYVYEPGQYAMRGSIVDIFSYASEQPVRLDFFGDEVDSIRTFDVQTQLSESTYDRVNIVPNEAMQGSGSPFIPIFDFLPEDTVLVTRSTHYISQRVAQAYQDGLSSQAEIENQATTQVPPADDKFDIRTHIVAPNVFDPAIARLRCIQLNPTSSAGEIHFSTSPQPIFHKSFDLVEQTCEKYLADGYRLYILADSRKQIERLQEIFATLRGGQGIGFTPVGHTIHEGFVDHTLRICLFTDHQIFDRFHKYNLKSDRVHRGKVALTLKELQQFQLGDYVVHIDHGIGRFGGLVNVPSDSGRGYQEMIKLIYQNEDIVYVSIHALHKISKYKGKEGEAPRINKLGSGAWERMKDRVKSKMKDIARDLIRLYAERMKQHGFAFSPDSYLQHELEASFLYEDTPDQLRATADVKADMQRPQPMDRLICGDVGFGKTEIAVRAAFKAAVDGKQTALLVPTTLLAYQHYQTFTSRMKDLPVRIDYLSRARTPKEEKQLLQDLENGRIDILIGTHKIIGKNVRFKDLGLLIIDEEQKFGVAVKEKLRQIKVNVDTLTMTATPIPRTLQFSLMGARDMSVLQTPPPNRYPIQTEIHPFSSDIIAEAINFEMSRNGQVYLVNNKISNLPELETMIRRNVPDARVCVGHGRMDPKELEKNMLGFINYDYDVMISTTIVENGIDVPNANTIIINSAHNYGLSDLHQMRGRVGRSNKKAFCYLLCPPLSDLPDDARRRLQAIENHSDLGSGINIAMQDLDIRGAGNLLGPEQSGFIADLGYEAYQKILAEAMQELSTTPDPTGKKEDTTPPQGNWSSPPSEGVGEVTIESDIGAYFSESYVPSSSERMNLYRRLDNLTRPHQLETLRKELVDRFGPPPPEAEELLNIMPLKWTAARLGIVRLILKRQRMACYLVEGDDHPYYQSNAFLHVIHYATHHPHDCKLREEGSKRSLLITSVQTIAQALEILVEMRNISLKFKV